ncbi:HAD-IB family hydrolase [Patulibacter defluvii]|uniref:HAD-IB family hydrolase n=1 Tax=Patulibacter defluvii TaxID=3095358 RepID=UPI002A74995F|nr:HAD-IB family hydrolase [Patulibacter sp. DM4]
MTTLDELLARIERAPAGPAVLAAFDYDGTIVAGYSATAFYAHRLRQRQIGLGELAELLRARRRGLVDDAAFAGFLDASLARLAGHDADELHALGRRLFKQRIAAQLRRETYALIEAHRRRGHTLVLASSALPFQTEPAADALELDRVLCTRAAVRDGRLTGRRDGPPLWGVEKAAALTRLADRLGADVGASFAYSNGGEDVPFLAAVGHGAAIAPDDDLRRAAARHGWPLLECREPAPRPRAGDVARTVGLYGGFAAAMGTATGVGLARRSRPAFLDLAIGVGADVSLAAAGVDVRVLRGAEHLWSARPCVFVFNHSSKLDAIVMMKLLREGFTGITKAEAKKVPMFGQLFQLAGMAMIDRSDGRAAIAQMQPVVEQLRRGVSLAVSPEGTRTPTPRLGPFKKGPFHVAMQAQVPIVPIVFRGIDEVQWRGAQLVRPGTVEVVVLPPVATGEWRPETVAVHRDHVRELMLAALDDWPAAAPARLPAGAAR